MGTPLVNTQRNSAALQNCAFVSTKEMTKNDPAKPFAFLMEASMLGVGVGFDDKGADKDFAIYEPIVSDVPNVYVVPDTREGWVESVALAINSYLKADQDVYDNPEKYFDEINIHFPVILCRNVISLEPPLPLLYIDNRLKYNSKLSTFLSG